MTFVMPWNISVAALERFLINTWYCRDEIGHLQKQAVIFTQFTDYILKKKTPAAGETWTCSLRRENPLCVWNLFFSARPQTC
jgi:hypothetical protein